MKNKIACILSLLSALALTSCFEGETTIQLKKDGSGTLIEDTRLGKSILAMPHEDLKAMLVEAEESAKQRAAKLGEGVTFVKFEKVSEGKSKGFRTTYQFKDINKLRLANQPEAGKDGGEDAEPNPETLITFQYDNGVLKIKPQMEEKKGDKPAAAGAGPIPDEQFAEMKEMFGEMKFRIKLTADSGIAATNATHVTGNTITLIDLDMGKIMAKPENKKKLGQVDEEDFSTVIDAFGGTDGLKAETKPEVTVTLK